jgi:acylphosphatase
MTIIKVIDRHLLEMDQSSTRLHAIVSGRVQGVNFRYSTLQRAQALRLTGWVRNLPNGTVEVLAEGPQPMLAQLLDFLHRGPPYAHVQSVQAEWQPATHEFTHFDVHV